MTGLEFAEGLREASYAHVRGARMTVAKIRGRHTRNPGPRHFN